jgi:hypothetical protein
MISINKYNNVLTGWEVGGSSATDAGKIIN